MTRSPIALYRSCFADAKSAMVGDRWPPSPNSIKDERFADSVREVNLATAFNVSYAINFSVKKRGYLHGNEEERDDEIIIHNDKRILPTSTGR